MRNKILVPIEGIHISGFSVICVESSLVPAVPLEPTVGSFTKNQQVCLLRKLLGNDNNKNLHQYSITPARLLVSLLNFPKQGILIQVIFTCTILELLSNCNRINKALNFWPFPERFQSRRNCLKTNIFLHFLLQHLICFNPDIHLWFFYLIIKSRYVYYICAYSYGIG